jgi:hypothetical protein
MPSRETAVEVVSDAGTSQMLEAHINVCNAQHPYILSLIRA